MKQQHLLKAQYEQMKEQQQQQHPQNQNRKVSELQNEIGKLDRNKMKAADSRRALEMYQAQQIKMMQAEEDEEVIQPFDTEELYNVVVPDSVGDAFDTGGFYNYFDAERKIKIGPRGLKVESTSFNQGSWYNLFGKLCSENDAQYHWKIRVTRLHSEGMVMIGVVDEQIVSRYQKESMQKANSLYIGSQGKGFAVDNQGNLKAEGEDKGKYSTTLGAGDVLSMYLDLRQYALWFGVNGKDFGVAFQVHQGAKYRMGISMFGVDHCLELVSCEVVQYDVNE